VNAVTLHLLTYHARVLLAAASAPDARVRDLAARTDLSERGVLRILAELERAGFLARVRVGRCTRYRIEVRRGLDDRIGRPMKVAELVALTRGAQSSASRAPRLTSPARTSPVALRKRSSATKSRAAKRAQSQ